MNKNQSLLIYFRCNPIDLFLWPKTLMVLASMLRILQVSIPNHASSFDSKKSKSNLFNVLIPLYSFDIKLEISRIRIVCPLSPKTTSLLNSEIKGICLSIGPLVCNDRKFLHINDLIISHCSITSGSNYKPKCFYVHFFQDIHQIPVYHSNSKNYYIKNSLVKFILEKSNPTIIMSKNSHSISTEILFNQMIFNVNEIDFHSLKILYQQFKLFSDVVFLNFVLGLTTDRSFSNHYTNVAFNNDTSVKSNEKYITQTNIHQFQLNINLRIDSIILNVGNSLFKIYLNRLCVNHCSSPLIGSFFFYHLCSF